MFGNMGYMAWNLNEDIDTLSKRRKEQDESEKGRGLKRFIDKVSRGVAVGFVSGGTLLGTYWILRNCHTVRRLILRKGGRNVT